MSNTPQESKEWVQHIITLLAVIVGGGITYLSNYLFERKNRKTTNDERRANDVYIPLCMVIEEYIDYFFNDTIGFNRDHNDYITVAYTLLKGSEWDNLYREFKRSRSAKFRYLLLSLDRKLIDDLYLEINNLISQIDGFESSLFSASWDLVTKIYDEKAIPEDIDVSEYEEAVFLAARGIPIEKMYEPHLDKAEIEMLEHA